MRILVVSDIHANVAALEAVLRHADAHGGVHRVWCIGDTVGYGPQPSTVIARLRELDTLWVAGNHERAATGAMSTADFNPDAAAAAEWTGAHLSDEEKAFLDALPEVIECDDFTLVHGSLRDPTWEYLYTPEVALAHLDLQTTPFGLVGHTHVPAVAILTESGRDCEFFRIPHGHQEHLDPARKLVFNAGSVGQPRDGNPLSSYAMYDTDERTLTLNRVEYEIKKTQELMAAEGLPVWLIQRLSAGR